MKCIKKLSVCLIFATTPTNNKIYLYKMVQPSNGSSSGTKIIKIILNSFLYLYLNENFIFLIMTIITVEIFFIIVFNFLQIMKYKYFLKFFVPLILKSIDKDFWKILLWNTHMTKIFQNEINFDRDFLSYLFIGNLFLHSTKKRFLK